MKKPRVNHNTSTTTTLACRMWSLKPVPFERSQGFLEIGLISDLAQLMYSMNIGHFIIPKFQIEEKTDL